MTHPTPTTEPAELRAGDTWAWRRSDLSNYPAPTWSLSYLFRNAANNFDIAAAADGADHLVSVAPAASAAFPAGSYHWYAFVTDGVDKHQVDAGALEVLPDISAAAAYDGRSWAKRVLDAVEAALENRATADQLDLINATAETGGFTRDRMGLLTMRSKFQLEVNRVNGTGGARRIVARFN